MSLSGCAIAEGPRNAAVTDRAFGEIGHLTDLAALPGMPSYQTLIALVASRPDFPLIRRGASGTPHIVHIPEAAAFVAAHWIDRRKQRDAPLPLFGSVAEEPATTGGECLLKIEEALSGGGGIGSSR